MIRQPERRTRFRARIEIERAFLTTVNNFYGPDGPLMGLTAAAIEAWARTAMERDAAGPAEVKAILLEAAKRSEILSDDSREVFDSSGAASLSSVEHLHQMLRDRLAV